MDIFLIVSEKGTIRFHLVPVTQELLLSFRTSKVELPNPTSVQHLVEQLPQHLIKEPKNHKEKTMFAHISEGGWTNVSTLGDIMYYINQGCDLEQHCKSERIYFRTDSVEFDKFEWHFHGLEKSLAHLVFVITPDQIEDTLNFIDLKAEKPQITVKD